MSGREVVRAEWLGYLQEVLPASPDQTQVHETRQAFYAGATALLAIVRKVGDLPEDEGVAALENISQELQRFAIDTVTQRLPDDSGQQKGF